MIPTITKNAFEGTWTVSHNGKAHPFGSEFAARQEAQTIMAREYGPAPSAERFYLDHLLPAATLLASTMQQDPGAPRCVESIAREQAARLAMRLAMIAVRNTGSVGAEKADVIEYLIECSNLEYEVAKAGGATDDSKNAIDDLQKAVTAYSKANNMEDWA